MADQKISQLTEKATLVGNDIITILDSENGNANKKAKVSAVTALSTYTATSPIDITSNVVSISTASTSTNGALTSTDWNTFNGKAAVQQVVNKSVTTDSLALASNTVYKYSNALTSLTITSIPSDTYEVELQFTTDSSFTFTATPLANKWIGVASPTFDANTSYVIAIKNGYAVLGKVGA